MDILVLNFKILLEVTVRLPDTAGARIIWRELKPKQGPFVYFNMLCNADIQITFWPNLSILNNVLGRKLRIINVADGPCGYLCFTLVEALFPGAGTL